MDDVYCSRCGKLITFVLTERGAKMPCESARIDFAPDPKGSTLAYLGDRKSIRGRVLDMAGEDTVKAYLPHWARCSYVKEQSMAAQEGNRAAPPRSAAEAAPHAVPRAAHADELTSSGGAPHAALRGSPAPERTRSRSKTGRTRSARKAPETKREAPAAVTAYEQLSLFPEPRIRMKERVSAFDV